MTPVTYGELRGLAASRIEAGGIAIAQKPLDSPEAARQAVITYRDLLAGLAEHAAYLVGHVPALDRPYAVTTASSQDLAAALLRRLLEERAARGTAAPALADHPASAAWAGAAEALRAARDLLDTHRDPDRRWRTPDAWRLDHPDLRWQALVDLAELVDATAPGGRDLAARVLEAQHLPEPEVADLRDPQRLQAGASAVLSLHRDRPIELSAIAGLGLAQPPPQRADPLQRALQAIGRLRQRAWERHDTPYVGVSTLGHYAALAVLVHQHAAVAVQAVGARAPQLWPTESSGRLPAVLTEAASACRTASAAWREVRDELAGLRTPIPLSGNVRDDYVLVRDGLAHATRSRNEWMNPDRLVPDRAAALHLLGALRSPLASVSEIGAWHRRTSARLVLAGEVFQPAVRLTGDEVADEPTLVQAKLDRRAVPASPAQQRALRHGYSAATDVSSRAVRAYGHALAAAAETTWRPAAGRTEAVQPSALLHLPSR